MYCDVLPWLLVGILLFGSAEPQCFKVSECFLHRRFGQQDSFVEFLCGEGRVCLKEFSIDEFRYQQPFPTN